MSGIALYGYVFVSGLWAVYSVVQQSLHYPSPRLWGSFFCGALNFVFCPIGIMFAIVAEMRLLYEFRTSLQREEHRDEYGDEDEGLE